MKKNTLKNTVNLIILFLCTEVLRFFLSEIPEFKNLDIRIIFVLISSSYFGIKYGIASAILASISYIMQEYFIVKDINIILLNSNNWVPIVIYIVFSVIIGLKADKESIKLKDLQNEIEAKKRNQTEDNNKIEKYEKEIKELNQILMVHNNSYIQTAEFIKKIQKSDGNKEKISTILKKYLNNTTCELLTIEEISQKTNGIVNDEKIKEMEEKNIWINQQLEEDLPFYIAPICINKNEKMAIVIWKCDFEQMNTEYRNQIIGILEIMKYILEMKKM